MGVLERVDGWQLNKTEFMVSGIRVFWEGPGIAGAATLPNLGDSFWLGSSQSAATELGVSGDEKIICRNMEISIVAPNTEEEPIVTQYMCQYSNEETDWTFWNNALDVTLENLPVMLEVGGDFLNLNPSADGVTSDWYWGADGSSNLVEPIPYRVMSATLRVTRFITDISFADWQSASLLCLGNTNGNNLSTKSDPTPTTMSVSSGNSGNNLFSQLVGGWLYASYMSEPHYTWDPSADDNAIHHRVEMTFLFRGPCDFKDPTQYYQSGWDLILRNNNTWSNPISTSKSYIYGAVANDFATLF